MDCCVYETGKRIVHKITQTNKTLVWSATKWLGKRIKLNAIIKIPIIKEMELNLILEGMCSLKETKRDRGIALWNHTLKAYEEKGSEREN